LLILFNEANKASGDFRYDQKEVSYSLELKAGTYPVRGVYTNAGYHGAIFTVSYEDPGLAKQEIPARAQFHEPER
jgi:hypothetical protein